MREALVHCNDLASAGLLRVALTSAGFEVIDAPTTADVLSRMNEHPADAVIVDLDDGEGDGAGYLACKLLRERWGEQLPIVLLSGTRATPADRVAGLLLGADEYVVKPFHASEVITRMRRLVARSDPSATPADRNDGERIEDFDLTERERQVMERLLLGRTQAEIASELVISSNTVATHIQRILLKLGVHNRAQAVAKVAQAGWLLQKDADGSAASVRGTRRDENGRRSDSNALWTKA